MALCRAISSRLTQLTATGVATACVALVMEVWDAKYRPLLAGMIGAAANVGFVLRSLFREEAQL